MRAMHNPTRMKVIREALEKLVKLMKRTCPNCSIPGFDVAEVIHGLQCEQCNFPTNSTHTYIYRCVKCQFEEHVKYPHGKIKEDPRYCDFCNP